MYLTRGVIENIKGMKRADLSFEPGSEPGWHVILGDNGAGKTSLIKALALGFIGPNQAQALLEDWSQWITWGELGAKIGLTLVLDPNLESQFHGGIRLSPQFAEIRLTRNDERHDVTLPKVGGQIVDINGEVNLVGSNHPRSLNAGRVWNQSSGWFSSSFGPLRRFSGGSDQLRKYAISNPQVARHLSAFRDDADLSQGLEWLVERKRDEEDGHAKVELISTILRFINHTQLSSHAVRIKEISSREIIFEDARGAALDVSALSHGYQSILSLTFELLRQLTIAYGESRIFAESAESGDIIVDLPGVVLIDEVDSHLHPTWQATIGEWFKARFPRLQFIVTTHSPLVCRAVGDDDAIFRLRAPDDPEGETLSKLSDLERDKLRFGSVHKALESEGFGLNLSRPQESMKMLHQLSLLNRKARKGPLDESEAKERRRLQDLLSDDPRSIAASVDP